MGKSRRSRSRRTRKRRGSGGLVTCMAKCRDDAAKSGSVAGEMKSAIKGIAAKPLGQQMSALQKYKAAAEKQKTVASKGLSDAKATIAKVKEVDGTRAIHALSGTARAGAGKRKKRRSKSKRRRKKSKSRKSKRRKRRSKKRRRKSKRRRSRSRSRSRRRRR